ncbi:MAG: hypothetical protein LBP34_04540 [Flavobacteriaceae bacterium]|nr:hypothetical protein [Flavobacteriaceae bacterium]
MNENLNPLESIQEIKAYMQKSSRFLSLSGWSGIWVGTCGIISGLLVIYFVNQSGTYDYTKGRTYRDYTDVSERLLTLKLLITAITTFIIAISGGFFFSMRKAKKEGIPFVNHIFRRMVVNFSIPLITGGFICLALIKYDMIILMAPCTLIFYGLSLLVIARDTLDEVRKLALFEIVLGILALFLLQYSVIFWVIGFGFLHIIYGIIMKNKYDTKTREIGERE